MSRTDLPALAEESNEIGNGNNRDKTDTSDWDGLLASILHVSCISDGVESGDGKERRTAQAAKPRAPWCKAQVVEKYRCLGQPCRQDKQSLGGERNLAAGYHFVVGQVPDMNVPPIPGRCEDDTDSDSRTEDLETIRR